MGNEAMNKQPDSLTEAKASTARRFARRLCNDDFVALRSLARGRWVQGREIEWKVNRTWLCVPFSSSALDAAFRLVEVGLVENFVCCPACGEVFQLTETGRALANQVDRGPVANVLDEAPQTEAQPPEAGGWFHRLVQVFSTHSRMKEMLAR